MRMGSYCKVLHFSNKGIKVGTVGRREGKLRGRIAMEFYASPIVTLLDRKGLCVEVRTIQDSSRKVAGATS